jgi:Zn-finger protein
VNGPRDDEGIACRCGHVDHDDDAGCMLCGCPLYRPVTSYSYGEVPAAVVKALRKPLPKGDGDAA